ncbi:MAG: LysE family translocator [Anaerolineales bacterium]
MDASLFLRGLVIGFSIAAPVGPIGVLCIRRTLAYGRAAGLVSGLGAASADSVYGAVAAFGLSLVAGFFIGYQELLKVVGGLYLMYRGYRTLTSVPQTEDSQLVRESLLSSYVSTFFLTLTNPMTIIAFAAIFTGLGLVGERRDLISASMTVLGVFIGSALWWFILSAGVGLLGRKMRPDLLLWVNRVSGVVILIFGLVALYSVISVRFIHV